MGSIGKALSKILKAINKLGKLKFPEQELESRIGVAAAAVIQGAPGYKTAADVRAAALDQVVKVYGSGKLPFPPGVHDLLVQFVLREALRVAPKSAMNTPAFRELAKQMG